MESTETIVLEEKPTIHTSNSTSVVWPAAKPFVNGWLTGQFLTLLSCVGYLAGKNSVSLAGKVHSPHQAHLNDMLNAFRKRLPAQFLFNATYAAARFGIFETLNARVVAINDGRSATLYQEGCCGLISGAIGACIWHPLNTASAHMRAQSFAQQQDYRVFIHHLHSTLRTGGFLALWKGSGSYLSQQMALNMGMLASYRPSLNYFEESIGVNGTKAQLGAGMVSAFFAASCSYSCDYINAFRDILQRGGIRKYSYRHVSYCAFQVLKPGGGFKFYTGLFTTFVRIAPHIMVQWITLETIRGIEESNGL